MIKRVWDLFTDSMGRTLIHPQFYLKRYNYTAVEFARRYANGSLIDIGCGRMPYRKILEAKVDKYIGLDSPSTAKLYKGKFKPDIFADATKIPLTDKSCDTALFFQVMEHLPEPQKALAEIHRILKPKGLLILSTIQSYPEHDSPHDYYRYTEHGISHLLTSTGFKVIKKKSEGNVFVLMGQSVNVYLMNIVRGLLSNTLTMIPGLGLLPFILVVAMAINFIVWPLSYLDKNSKFSVIHTFVARR